MKKTLLQEVNPVKKKFLPPIFSQAVVSGAKFTYSGPLIRKIEAKKYQSEILCLRTFKDGINLPKP
ncbi:hypothetical protein FW781_19610 [Chryseobacterium panacisoli]|uniref:Uncharacterized protein n=1 Tax=Chryseobacterium panacisoli TaxID=1807141 RepID=A0A5D8ZDZ1_9FLAO|nr:hypothetical protein [Chryseobacterium panacisoli]TZF93175.1 hypothetical protein FW781_19610 [Chryseobacterium panacisoli]